MLQPLTLSPAVILFNNYAIYNAHATYIP